ncbi:transcriptional regulator, partial [Agathobacter rectalis]
MLKINIALHIAISEKQCYNSYIPKKEAVSM